MERLSVEYMEEGKIYHNVGNVVLRLNPMGM